MRRKLILLTATKGLFLLSAFCFLLSSCQQEEEFIPQGKKSVWQLVPQLLTAIMMALPKDR